MESNLLPWLGWLEDLKTRKCVWDGTFIYLKEFLQESKIWSSSILYKKDMKAVRKEWFADWLLYKHQFSGKILEFYRSENLGTKETASKMKRSFTETVSITSVKKQNKTVIIFYENLGD